MIVRSANDKAPAALPQSSFIHFNRLLVCGLVLFSTLNSSSASADFNWPWKKKAPAEQSQVNKTSDIFYDWRMPSGRTLRFVRDSNQEWSLGSVFDGQGNLIEDCPLLQNRKKLKQLPALSRSTPRVLVGTNVRTMVIQAETTQFTLLANGQKWENGTYVDDYLEVTEEALHSGPPVSQTKIELPSAPKEENLYEWEMPDGKKIFFKYGKDVFGTFVKIHEVHSADGKLISNLNVVRASRVKYLSLPVPAQDPERLNRLGIEAESVIVEANQKSFKLKASVVNPATGDKRILEQEFNSDLLISGGNDPNAVIVEEIKNTQKLPTIDELNPASYDPTKSTYSWKMSDGKTIVFAIEARPTGPYIYIKEMLDVSGTSIPNLLIIARKAHYLSLPVPAIEPDLLTRLKIPAQPVMVRTGSNTFDLTTQTMPQDGTSGIKITQQIGLASFDLKVDSPKGIAASAPQAPAPIKPATASVVTSVSEKLGTLSVVNGELIWTLTDGEAIKFYNDAQLLKPTGSTYLSTRIIHAGEAYVIVSVKPTNLTGESFILREADGVLTRLGPGLVDMMGITIVDGVLSVKSTLRKIDLDHFDLEATFKINPKSTSLSDISGYKDLGAELKLEPLLVDHPNEDLRKSIFRGLMQEELGSTVILGEGGTGKTTQVKAMIQETALGKTKLPRTWRFLEVTKTTLEANTSLVGQSSERLAALLKATEDVPTVLVMDEIHSFKGIGTHSNNSNDMFETLKDRLASGKLKIIGMSTQAEFYPAFAGNGPLLDRFKIYDQHPPKTNEEIGAILKSWAKRFRKVIPSTEVLNRVIDLSEEFNAMGYQPRKAISLLDQVYAELTLEGRMRVPPDLAMVEKVAAATYNIGADHFDKVAMAKRVNELEDRISQKIIGHEEAIKAFVNLSAQAEAGINSADKPAFMVMFPGPPGTGKTEIAKTYAAEIGLPFVKIEMNQYANGKPVEDLLKEISSALRKNAKTVILLDEFEKAHISIQNGVLSMFDSGKFNVSESLGANPNSGKRTFAMSARHARFILATNAGTEIIQANTDPLTGSLRLSRKDLVEELKKTISHPVIDRMDEIIPFRAPTRSEFKKVVLTQIKRELKAISQAKGAEYTLDNLEEYAEDVVKNNYVAGNGSREVARVIKRELKTNLAHLILKSAPARGTEVKMQYNRAAATAAGGPCSKFERIQNAMSAD